MIRIAFELLVRAYVLGGAVYLITGLFDRLGWVTLNWAVQLLVALLIFVPMARGYLMQARKPHSAKKDA